MAGTLFFLLGLVAFSQGGAVVPAVPVAAPFTVPLAKLEEFDAVPQYSFAYDVQDAVTGDSKAQYETRNGDVVQGSYSLIEADGTRRIVQYTADPINGFNAIVNREPATAVAAVAAPSVLPLRPASLTPIAVPFGPAAVPAAPSIPAVGPDSDVEVVDARTGRLTSTRVAARDQEIQRQRQLQRLQEQQRRPPSRIQISQQQQQEQQQERQQQIAADEAARQPIASARLTGLPVAARTIANYPYAYSAAYSSPFAYAAPLAYAPTVAAVP